MIKLLLIFMLFSTNLFAWDDYVLENSDGTLTILSHNPASSDSIEKIAGNRPFHKLTNENKPTDYTDIDFWKWDDSRVVVDEVKKQAALDAKQAKLDSKNAVLAKLKINEQELKDLLGN